MAMRIGLLLPRSTDYPSLGFDVLDAFRLALKQEGITDVNFFTENTGFGEDGKDIYSKAERLIIQQDVQMIVVFASPIATADLHQLADATGRTFLLLDAGMQYIEAAPSSHVLHITLQGLPACRMVARMAGDSGKRVLNATSFFDAGYRGPYDFARGIAEAGGSIAGNYISGHRVDEFSISNYMALLNTTDSNAVAACFSTYLSELFIDALKKDAPASVPHPFYCSPFMAEEQLLTKHDFPGGEFHTIVPWSVTLSSPAQQAFTNLLQEEKSKTPNIFSLLGWEAGLTAAHVFNEAKPAAIAVKDKTFDSPRGLLAFHPDTNCAYAPLYQGRIVADNDGRCKLEITKTLPVTPDEHLHLFRDRPEGVVSNWKNTYFCT
jgi:branched-chain amino acid transport system substrate-binding protein